LELQSDAGHRSRFRSMHKMSTERARHVKQVLSVCAKNPLGVQDRPKSVGSSGVKPKAHGPKKEINRARPNRQLQKE
jgi:hypothetical protein